MDEITERLESIRRSIEDECVSYGEIAELQSLVEHIDPGDILLLQWAGVPEFEELHEGYDESHGPDCKECDRIAEANWYSRNQE